MYWLKYNSRMALTCNEVRLQVGTIALKLVKLETTSNE